MKIFTLFTLAFLFLFIPLAVQAQEKNELAISAIVVRQDPDIQQPQLFFNQDTDQAGIEVSFSRFFRGPFGLTIDAATSFSSRQPLDINLQTLTAGPVVKRQQGVLRPFAHALFGASHLTGAGVSDIGFSTAIGGGLDIRVHKNISVRAAKAEYVSARAHGSTVDSARLGAGLVFSF